MDIEAFVNQEGREALVNDVRKKIDELGITYIYYQFVSLTGRIMGKGAPADHWGRCGRKNHPQTFPRLQKLIFSNF